MDAGLRRRAALSHLATTLGNMVCLNVSVTSVFGVFLLAMARDLGWPRAQITGALALIALVSVVAYPLVGQLIDRFGARPVIVPGSALFALGVMAIRWVPANVPGFYLTFALIGALGAAPSTAMFAKVISRWFTARRGLMLGISAGVGNGLGATLMPIFAASLLAGYGWRTSYFLVGLTVFMVATPALFLWLWEPDEAPLAQGKPDADQVHWTSLIATPRFWLIFSSVGLVAGCLSAIFSHAVPILSDRGFGMGLASAIMAVMGLSASVGQIACGYLMDRTSGPRLVVLVYGLAVVGMAGLMLASGLVLLALSGAFLGGALGMTYAALPYFISRYFALDVFGRMAGLAYAAVMLAQGMLPFAMDLWFDRMGSYSGAVALLAGFVCLASGLVCLLPAYSQPELGLLQKRRTSQGPLDDLHTVPDGMA